MDFKVTDHPLGGKFHWHHQDGRAFSILDSDYPYADDFELQERATEDNEDVDTWSIIPEREVRFQSLSDAMDWIASQSAATQVQL